MTRNKPICPRFPHGDLLNSGETKMVDPGTLPLPHQRGSVIHFLWILTVFRDNLVLIHCYQSEATLRAGPGLKRLCGYYCCLITSAVPRALGHSHSESRCHAERSQSHTEKPHVGAVSSRQIWASSNQAPAVDMWVKKLPDYSIPSHLSASSVQFFSVGTSDLWSKNKPIPLGLGWIPDPRIHEHNKMTVYVCY